MKTFAMAQDSTLAGEFGTRGDDGVTNARVAGAVYGLSDRERLVLALQYMEGFRVREIATILELSTSYVYRLRSRALRKVRDEVGQAPALAA